MNSGLFVIVLIASVVITSVWGHHHYDCGSKHVKVHYQGEACDCGEHLPIHIEKPQINVKEEKFNSYGYKVIKPAEKPCDVKYSFDFQLQKPEIKQHEYIGGHYGYKVQVPHREKPDIKYHFDVNYEVPQAKPEAQLLHGLVTKVDKIMLQKKDCVEPMVKKFTPCQGSHVETIKPCKLFENQSGFHYDRPHQQGSSEEYSEEHYSDYILPIHYGSRNKRDTKMNLKSKNILPYSVKQTNTLRKSHVKQKGNSKAKERVHEEFTDSTGKTVRNSSKRDKYLAHNNANDNVLKIKKVEMIKSIEPQTYNQKTNKLRKNKRRISKRSTTYQHADKPKLDLLKKDYQFKSVKKLPLLCPTIESLKKSKNIVGLQKPEVLQYMPEIQKDCESCGNKYKCCPCKSCLSSKCKGCSKCCMCPCQMQQSDHRPQYIEYVKGTPVMYNPGPAYTTYESHIENGPRFVFDQMGHRYIENNGALKIIPPTYDDDYTVSDKDDPFVGSARGTPAQYNKDQAYNNERIRNLILSHPFYIHSVPIPDGELTVPPAEQQREMMEFIREIAEKRFGGEVENFEIRKARENKEKTTPNEETNSNLPIKQIIKLIPYIYNHNDRDVDNEDSRKTNKNWLQDNEYEPLNGNIIQANNMLNDKSLINMDHDIVEVIEIDPKHLGQSSRIIEIVKDKKKYEILTPSNTYQQTKNKKPINIVQYFYNSNENLDDTIIT